MNNYYLVKKYLLLVLILPSILFSTACIGENDKIPEITESDTGPYFLNMAYMDLLKSKLDDPFIQGEYNRLIEVADTHLINDFEYVTDKAHIPPSGDINDYMSLARYRWPDPATGEYSIIRDGVTNPEIYQFDRPKLDRISNAIFHLSLAYFYSGIDDYAKKATELISNWFLENDTRMNPNLNYAQVALGYDKITGSHQGLIDTNDFIRIVDSVSLIYESHYWTHSKHIELKAWFYSFSKWIDGKYNADDFCRDSRCNNVATWFDAQKIIYFLFTEREGHLNRDRYIQPIEEKIKLQFTPEGYQLNESTRSLSQHYFYFNLRAYMKIASMRKQRSGSDRDWPKLNSADFGGIKPSLDVIVKHLNGEDVTDFFNQASGFDDCRYLEIFKPAALIFDHPEYEDIAQQLLSNPACSNLNISLTLPPLEWLDTQVPENASRF